MFLYRPRDVSTHSFQTSFGKVLGKFLVFVCQQKA